MDCIFCKIAAGEIPSKKVYEDENVLVFHDISPQTPVHMLIIPKLHIASAAEVTGENSWVLARIFEVIAKVTAGDEFKDGFRVVSNCGSYAGQTVFHLHFHILAGKKLELKMG